MSITIKHVSGAKLTLDSGETLMVEKLGKGMFHTCYVDHARQEVYSITINRDEAEDYSKEILSHCDENPHIPAVQHIGDMADDRRVYRMPLYQPIKAKEHRAAFGLLKQLMQAREDAWAAVVMPQVYQREKRVSDMGYMVNDRVIELMDAPGVPQSLKDALQELRDNAANYGSGYCFEFSKRNVMVDENGTLVLLDVLFDLEAVERIRNAKAKQSRGW